MKVNGFQNIPAVLQSLRTEKSMKSVIDGGRGEDSSVSLSSFGEVLQSLQREAAKGASSRNIHVENLSHQEKAGGLSVDLDRLASRLVDLNVLDLQG